MGAAVERRATKVSRGPVNKMTHALCGEWMWRPVSAASLKYYRAEVKRVPEFPPAGEEK